MPGSSEMQQVLGQAEFCTNTKLAEVSDNKCAREDWPHLPTNVEIIARYLVQHGDVAWRLHYRSAG